MPTTRSLAAAAGGLPAADPGWPSLRRLRDSNRARNPERPRNRSEAADNPERPSNRAIETDPDTAIETDPAIEGPPYEVWMGIYSCGVEDVAEAKIVSKKLVHGQFP